MKNKDLWTTYLEVDFSVVPPKILGLKVNKLGGVSRVKGHPIQLHQGTMDQTRDYFKRMSEKFLGFRVLVSQQEFGKKQSIPDG